MALGKSVENCAFRHRRLALQLSTLLLLGVIGAFTGCRSPALSTPEGVLKSERKVMLTGKEVAVDSIFRETRSKRQWW